MSGKELDKQKNITTMLIVSKYREKKTIFAVQTITFDKQQISHVHDN